MAKLTVLCFLFGLVGIGLSAPARSAESDSAYKEDKELLDALSKLVADEQGGNMMSKRGRGGLWRFGKRAEGDVTSAEQLNSDSSLQTPSDLEILLLKYELEKKIQELDERNRLSENYLSKSHLSYLDGMSK